MNEATLRRRTEDADHFNGLKCSAPHPRSSRHSTFDRSARCRCWRRRRCRPRRAKSWRRHSEGSTSSTNPYHALPGQLRSQAPGRLLRQAPLPPSGQSAVKLIWSRARYAARLLRPPAATNDDDWARFERMAGIVDSRYRGDMRPTSTSTPVQSGRLIDARAVEGAAQFPTHRHQRLTGTMPARPSPRRWLRRHSFTLVRRHRSTSSHATRDETGRIRLPCSGSAASPAVLKHSRPCARAAKTVASRTAVTSARQRRRQSWRFRSRTLRTVIRVVCAIDCGTGARSGGVQAQMEAGSSSVTAALFGEITVERPHPTKQPRLSAARTARSA